MALSHIDACLGQYYEDMSRTDYYDDDGQGKFALFCEENELEDEDVDEELKGDAADCLYLDMDDNFPLSANITEEDDKQTAIFQIFQQCYQATAAVTSVSSNSNDHQLLINLERISDDIITQAYNDCKKYCRYLLVMGGIKKNKDLCLLIACNLSYNKPIFRYLSDTFDVWRNENNITDRNIKTMYNQCDKFKSFIHKNDKINEKNPRLLNKFKDLIFAGIGFEKARIARPILLNPDHVICDNLIHYVRYIDCINNLIMNYNGNEWLWHLDVMIIPNKIRSKQSDHLYIDVESRLKQSKIQCVTQQKLYKNNIRNLKLDAKFIKPSKRMILVIDRRQNQYDNIYLYEAPKPYNEVPDIAKTYLPESNFANSKQAILPQDSLGHNAINAYTPNPNVFVLSYHTFSKKCIRVYWSTNGTKTRFYYRYIWMLWTKYFAANSYNLEVLRKIQQDHMNNKKASIYEDNNFDSFCSEII
eukprot:486037_1